MNKTSSPIYVTQPTLPPMNELMERLEEVWKNHVLTNGGPLHQELEKKLCEFLGVKFISLFCNATVALTTAIQCLELKGEVITTPFSFLATANALRWNGVTPVFADIDFKTFNLDPRRIADMITPKTTAIMPVHCYGRPCDVDAISDIALAHDLRVIYDAAHAFSVPYHDQSVLNFGDLSVLSFHATKVFNTFEGGAIVCRDMQTKLKIDQLKNFGLVDNVTAHASGLNGKMSELNAAVGLVQLKYIPYHLEARRLIAERYRENLSNCIGLSLPPPFDGNNNSYFPIIINDAARCDRDALWENLQRHDIFPRRYFYPPISSFPMYSSHPSAAPQNIPVANTVAEKILCLPIFPALTFSDVDRICSVITRLI